MTHDQRERRNEKIMHLVVAGWSDGEIGRSLLLPIAMVLEIKKKMIARAQTDIARARRLLLSTAA